MPHHTDWLPGSRAAILDMCAKWYSYLTETRRTAWGIPAAEYTELRTLYALADEVFERARDKSERTHVLTVECQVAFANLSAKMRFFRDRYFKMPPLSLVDWAELQFRAPDENPTPVPPPDGVPEASLSYSGVPHVINARLRPRGEAQELDPRSDYGYTVYVGIMPPGGATVEQAASPKHYLMTVPANGNGLRHYRFTRRRREKIHFDPEDAGMTAFVCCRYENQKGDEGDWGPVISAVIP